MTWFDETLHSDLSDRGYGQRLKISRTLYEDRSDHQAMTVFESPFFGRVLTLDGVVQTTERDEFCYHEMIAHVPILARGAATDVLIIGGGDGGVLREVVRHAGIAQVTMVEIDESVVNVCREHLPALSNGAFEDPRANLIIGDGLAYVAETDEQFDVIIVDSTDPIGPGEVLFTEAFYRDCHRCLRPGGVLVTQSGVPFMQSDELKSVHQRLAPVFACTTFYLAVVPTYVGGFMTLGFATDNPALTEIDVTTLSGRMSESDLSCRYYSADVHRAAFALPPFIRSILDD